MTCVGLATLQRGDPIPTHRTPFSFSLGTGASSHKGHPLSPTASMEDLGPVPELAPTLCVTEPVTAISCLTLSLGHMTELDSVLSQVPLSFQGFGMRYQTTKQIASITAPTNIFKTHQGCCEQSHAVSKLVFTLPASPGFSTLFSCLRSSGPTLHPHPRISLSLGFHSEGHSEHPMFCLGCPSDRQEFERKQVPSWERPPHPTPRPHTL